MGLKVFASTPLSLTKQLIRCENLLKECKEAFVLSDQKTLEESLVDLELILDSLSQNPALHGYPTMQARVTQIKMEAREIRDYMDPVLATGKNTSVVEMNAEMTTSVQNPDQQPEIKEYAEALEMIFMLMQDTATMSGRIREVESENETLKSDLSRYKTGIFFGLGFGYNYFMNAPLTYYVQEDSTLASYGETRGMSFILSGFLAYKITPKHSVIFNVPLGDITNRDDFRIGLFNKKMAGGLGYGYNLGNVSIICIVNVSPYEQIAYNILKAERFEEDQFTRIDPGIYPNVTRYSPSCTIGLSYNFAAPERFIMEGF